MIEIQNVNTIDGKKIDHRIQSDESRVLDGTGFTLLPALIDPHVHFRTPGAEYKENWESGAKAAIAGGVTTVLDMPNNHPSCSSLQRVMEKRALIEEQLKKVNIPLRYGLYLGADRFHLQEIGRSKEEIVGLKIYMGSSTGDLLMNDLTSLQEAFALAGKANVLVAVHAEDEELIQLNQKKHLGKQNPALHSEVRSNQVAAKAVALAIEMAKKTHARLYVVHTSTADELALIRQAKKEKLPVFAEASPHHLFLTTDAYGNWGTKALVNPPLRKQKDQEALWEAIHDGTIDTIGTDHAPHTLAEKNEPYGKAPSGFPSIELYLPLLLNAHSKGEISLEKIVALTHTHPQKLFSLPPNRDVVLVDLNKEKLVTDEMLYTKAKWSPYKGLRLRGWPRYTILRGRLYDLEAL